jgi:hypothetical protein
MKLRKPPFPDPVGGATYFCIQAGHRETAIETAMAVIREADKRERGELAEDPVLLALTDPMADWVIESLLQGSWMREYHEWEKATKAYFDCNQARNGASKVAWNKKLAGVPRPSHVDRVRAQLKMFGATLPPGVLDVIDRTRDQVNLAKHEGEHFIGEAGYRTLVRAVLGFWEALEEQEEFTPPARLCH